MWLCFNIKVSGLTENGFFHLYFVCFNKGLPKVSNSFWSLDICGQNFRHWFGILFEICIVEVRVLSCSWNQFQMGMFGIFAITYFLGCFIPWNFEEMEEKSLGTCWFTIIHDICLVDLGFINSPKICFKQVNLEFLL